MRISPPPLCWLVIQCGRGDDGGNERPLCQTNGSSAVTVVVLAADHGDIAPRRSCCCGRIPSCGAERLRYYSAACGVVVVVRFVNVCAWAPEYGKKQRVAIRGRCWYHGNFIPIESKYDCNPHCGDKPMNNLPVWTSA